MGVHRYQPVAIEMIPMMMVLIHRAQLVGWVMVLNKFQKPWIIRIVGAVMIKNRLDCKT